MLKYAHLQRDKTKRWNFDLAHQVWAALAPYAKSSSLSVKRILRDLEGQPENEFPIRSQDDLEKFKEILKRQNGSAQ